MSRTLDDKLVDAHKVRDLPDGDVLSSVDVHIMNEYVCKPIKSQEHND